MCRSSRKCVPVCLYRSKTSALVCVCVAVPPADGSEIPSWVEQNGGVLHFSKVTRADAGNYSCVASNSLQGEIRAVVQLTVAGKLQQQRAGGGRGGGRHGSSFTSYFGIFFLIQSQILHLYMVRSAQKTVCIRNAAFTEFRRLQSPDIHKIPFFALLYFSNH